MKAGTTEEGTRAATSHTGGLATRALSAELIFRKAGMIPCTSTRELVETAAGFALQPVPEGNRVVILTNTGGPAVIAADVLAAGGCRIPPLSKKTRDILESHLPPEASINNPVDVVASATAEHFRICLDTLMMDENYDAVYLCLVTSPFADMKSVVASIVEFSRKRKKPIVCNLLTDRNEWKEVIQILEQGGIPLFDFPESAARCLCNMVSYHRLKTTDPGPVKEFPDVNKDAAASIIEAAVRARRKNLSAGDVYRILDAYGIPLADFRLASDGKEAQVKAGEIGYPVVVKADSQALVHKSDTGGVALNLSDKEAVASAVRRMKDLCREKDIRFLVQKYHPNGTEVICGAKAETEAGHMIMFGLGGIYVDILKDVSFNLTPLTPQEAEDMVLQIKAAPLLSGFRGQKGVDIEAVQEVLLRLSQMVTDLPMIRELDLNPLLAYKNRVLAVDARISIAPESL
jgi:acetyltransferase